MTTEDQIQDYVEYLVEHKNIRGLQDLLPNQRSKLSFLILINNNMYHKMIKTMHKTLQKEVNRQKKTRR